MSSSCADHLMEPISGNEDSLRKKLFSHLHLIKFIEVKDLQNYALTCIPVEDLTIKATQVLSTLEKDCGLEECLLVQLLEWFKLSFFSWVDVPGCQNCSQSTEYKGLVTPTPEEKQWLADTVESYFCNSCKVFTRFPRYNHPRKLLETRKGRCGEWANCFTLLCRSLDLDARLVIDWNDHVWVEMFSPATQKWMHCDPCENIYDQPLLYEIGWKKDMAIVIAFSKDEIQDVTWRYTCKFNEVLERRKALKCRETFLLAWINYHTEKLRLSTSAERLEFLVKRQALELAELLLPPEPKGEISGGRTSGSLAWRLARREIQNDYVCNSYVFTLSSSEIQNKSFHVQYNCASDEYIRVSDNYTKCKNWSSLIFNSKDVFRKVETDWKMSYLAREEGSLIGKITWKFDFEKSGLCIQNLKLKLLGTTFQNGKVKWHLSPIKNFGSQVVKVFNEQVLCQTPFETKDFIGAMGFTITAELSEGKGSSSWQHAQLFRQELTSSEFPFDVNISLENSESC